MLVNISSLNPEFIGHVLTMGRIGGREGERKQGRGRKLYPNNRHWQNLTLLREGLILQNLSQIKIRLP